jgi:hypothetical protein
MDYRAGRIKGKVGPEKRGQIEAAIMEYAMKASRV